MQNVMLVVDNNMCNGCCECISACTTNSIYIMMSKTLGRPVPFVADEAGCEECGACLKACPQSVLAVQTTA